MSVTETPEPASHHAVPGELPAAPAVLMPRRAARIGAAELRMGAVLLVALAVLGLIVGLVWGHVAPRAVYTVVDTQQKLAQQNNVESEAQVGVDGWFALLGAGVGLVTGFVAWRWRGSRGPFLVLALAVASLLGAVIAWRFGLWIGRHPTHAELQPIFDRKGTTFKPAIKMQAKGALFFQPLGAVLAAVLCAAFTRHTDLNRAGSGDQASRHDAVDHEASNDPS